MSGIQTRIVNLIKAGKLSSAEFVDKHFPPGRIKGYAISPALVLTFKRPFGLPRGNAYPLREQYWKDILPVIRQAEVPIKDSRSKTGSFYFKDVKVPRAGEYFWKLIEKTETGKEYYLHTSGIVAVHYKNGKERVLTPCMSSTQKKAMIKIGTKSRILKHLVAQAVYPAYKKGTPVLCRDRNEMNCDYKNLIITSKSHLGKLTGHLSGKGKPVRVYINDKWQVCRSARAAAKVLNCSYQTVLDALKGRVKKSCLEGRLLY